ncbi:MAG: O-antigen ligase family protein, partial [Candidatus Omnitrophota bacterium]
SPEFRTGTAAGREVAIRADDLFLFVIFIGWMAKMALNKELGVLRNTPLNAVILAYIVVCIFSSALGVMQDRISIKSSFFFNLKYIEYFLIFFMVTNNLKTMKQAKRFMFFLFLTYTIICLYSMVKIPTGARVTSPFEGRGGGEPNTLGGYLLFMMALAAGMMLYGHNRRNRIIFLTLFCAALLPLMFTLSRGSWLAFFPMVLTLLALTRRYKLPAIAVFILAVSALPFVAPQQVKARVQETFKSNKSTRLLGKDVYVSESAQARINSWSVAFKKFNIRPVVGHGVPGGTVIDNQYVRVLIETGMAGFILFALILGMMCKTGFEVLRSAESTDFARGLSLGFLAGLVGLLFHSLSAATFILVRIMEPFWFVAAILFSLPVLIEKEKEKAPAYTYTYL